MSRNSRIKSISDYFGGGEDEKYTKKQYEQDVQKSVSKYTANVWNDRVYINHRGDYFYENSKLYFQKNDKGLPELVEKTTERQIHSTLTPRSSFRILDPKYDRYAKEIYKKFGITKKTTFDEFFDEVKNKSNVDDKQLSTRGAGSTSTSGT